MIKHEKRIAELERRLNPGGGVNITVRMPGEDAKMREDAGVYIIVKGGGEVETIHKQT